MKYILSLTVLFICCFNCYGQRLKKNNIPYNGFVVGKSAIGMGSNSTLIRDTFNYFEALDKYPEPYFYYSRHESDTVLQVKDSLKAIKFLINQLEFSMSPKALKIYDSDTIPNYNGIPYDIDTPLDTISIDKPIFFLHGVTYKDTIFYNNGWHKGYSFYPEQIKHKK